MRKIYHFVPSLDIGGVETAIGKSLPELNEKVDISIFYVRRRGLLDLGQMVWWRAFRNIFFAQPDLIITSLWWAHPFGLLFKLMGVRWVCFIHASVFFHFVDRLVCTAAVQLADQVAADSVKTATFVGSINKAVSAHVVPYIFPFPPGIPNVGRVKDSFIFVGRSSSQKRLDLVVGVFEYLLLKFPHVTCRFVVSGEVPAAVSNLGSCFPNRVFVEVNLSNNEVLSRLFASEYYVLFSDFEGFSMSAYEAVQAGCFVIYRDVGEIKTYVDPEMSLSVVDVERLFEEVEELIDRRSQIAIDPVVAEGSQLASVVPEVTYTSSFLSLVLGSSERFVGR